MIMDSDPVVRIRIRNPASRIREGEEISDIYSMHYSEIHRQPIRLFIFLTLDIMKGGGQSGQNFFWIAISYNLSVSLNSSNEVCTVSNNETSCSKKNAAY